MKQTVEIEVPDGKKAIWKDNKIIFEDIKPKLPKTWEEFCKQNNINKEEAYISLPSTIETMDKDNPRTINNDKNVLPSKQAAEQHLALMQLHQLRDCYRQGWKPDWNGYSKYVIVKNRGKYNVFTNNWASRFLTFQDMETAKEFLTNFLDLIKEAGDLI